MTAEFGPCWCHYTELDIADTDQPMLKYHDQVPDTKYQLHSNFWERKQAQAKFDDDIICSEFVWESVV